MVALLAVVVVWVLPPIVATQLTTRASEALGRKVAVGKVKLNPFTLSVTIEDFGVQEPDGTTPFFGWRRLYVNADALGSLWGQWSVSAVELEGLVARGHVKEDGTLSIADILARLEAQASNPAGEPKPSHPPRPIRIARLSVTQASADLADLSRPLPFRTLIGPLTFELTDFRTVAERGAPYRFEAVTEAGEKFSWRGTLRAEPFQSAGEFRLENIALPKYAPFYMDRLAAEVKSGALSIDARYELDLTAERRVMALSEGSVQLRNVIVHERQPASAAGGAGSPSAPGGEVSEPVLSLPALDVTDIAADGLTMKATIGSVQVKGGEIRARRNAQGAINLLGLLPPAPAPATPATTTAASPGPTPSAEDQRAPATAATAGAMPDVLVREVAVQDFALSWTDETSPRPAKVGLAQVALRLENVTLAPNVEIPMDLTFSWAPEGTVHVAGKVGLNPVRADLQTELGAFALLPLSPYLETLARVRITQGSVAGRMHTRVSLPSNGAVELAADGDVSLERFGLVDGQLNEELAGVGALRLRGLKATVGTEVAASIDEISIQGPYARVLIAADKTLNLAAVTATPAQPPARDAATQPAPQADASGVSASTEGPGPQGPAGTVAARPKLEIGRIVIADGDFRFTDRSVQPAAAVTVSQFGGTIGALSSINPAKGEVDLKAVVDGSGPIAITGRLDPLAPKPSIDLKVEVRNVDLVPLSPYTGKFAGYELARGKLAVDVKVQIDGPQIDSANVVTLNQFTFGNPVNSPEATKLPVRLAVALLKDRDGKIIIDLPVEGRTDDPEFRVGRVVMRVLSNLLVKVATSPFALLGAAFGGGGDELAYQEFAPGAVELQEAEVKKLETMTKALTNRPGLSLSLSGHYDPAADTFALKQSKLADRVRRLVWEQRRQLDPNLPPPAEIVVSDAEYAATIKRLFDEQFPPGTEFGTPLPEAPQVVSPPAPPPEGVLKRVWRAVTFAPKREQRRIEEARQEAAAAHEKAAAAAVATGLPVPDMAARLAESTAVDDADLRALAQARAERVRAYFTAQGIAPDRLFLANAGTGETGAKGPRVFLELQ